MPPVASGSKPSTGKLPPMESKMVKTGLQAPKQVSQLKLAEAMALSSRTHACTDIPSRRSMADHHTKRLVWEIGLPVEQYYDGSD